MKLIEGNLWKQYQRKQIAELRPYDPIESMDGISISIPDKEAGSPKVGDMIARNPKNHDDMWLVAAQYFQDNFEELGDTNSLMLTIGGVPIALATVEDISKLQIRAKDGPGVVVKGAMHEQLISSTSNQKWNHEEGGFDRTTTQHYRVWVTMDFRVKVDRLVKSWPATASPNPLEHASVSESSSAEGPAAS
jgi:hypothetical protein